MATMTLPGVAGGSRTGQVRRRGFMAMIRERLELWQAAEEMRAMSERELRDIGVSREQIPHLVRNGR
jgi:uncharacterized protein YjiS (DUF1127 family)